MGNKDIDTLFSECKEAFRLELLPRYTVEQEEEAYRLYLEGMPIPPQDLNKDWLELLDEARQKGQTFQRLRVLPRKNTAYILFEIGWMYPYSFEKGESIRLLSVESVERQISDLKGLNDFWLFDNKDALMMRYDPDGRFLDATIERRSDRIKALVETQDILWPLGINLPEFLKKQRRGESIL